MIIIKNIHFTYFIFTNTLKTDRLNQKIKELESGCIDESEV